MDAKRWSVGPVTLASITPEKARDLLVECFVTAQEETFRKTRQRLHMPTSQGELERAIAGVVRRAFTDCGHDFERPTVQALEDVADHLARQAAQFGTPGDVVQHHRAEFAKVTDALAA
jgi:hypothetical protein